MYFSDNLPGVNPVVMNYKIRHNKNQSPGYSPVWPDCFFIIIFGGRKTRSGDVWLLHVRVAMEEGLLSV